MPFSDITKLAQNTREFNKFLLDGDGEVCVRVCLSGDAISVESTPAGLEQGIVTVISVGTSVTALPATAASGRNHISIHNKSETQTLYYAFVNTVTADDAATGGFEIPPQGYANLDLKEGVVVYGIYPTSTEVVKVLEL
jgi:hypothetical protein